MKLNFGLDSLFGLFLCAIFRSCLCGVRYIQGDDQRTESYEAETMDVLTKPADEFGNDELLEELWAKRAYEHAELHFNLLCSVDPRDLKLSPFDETIYKTFREDFPEMKVDVIDEEELKSTASKTKWRNFIEKFNKLDDFAFGTLIRADSSKEFSPDNSIFVVRVQFLAIEIARNREGCNDCIRKNFAGKEVAE